MKILRSAEEAAAVLRAETVTGAADKPAAAVTWGNFDGVHLGHQSLIFRLTERAVQLGLPSVVMTFFPRPAVFFHGDDAPKAITQLDDKLALLERLGVDYTLVLPFSPEVAALEPEEFLTRLPVGLLGAKAMVLGYDVAFGRNRRGGFDFLLANADRYGYSLEQAPPLAVEGRPVSSTRIREELAAGNLAAIPKLLGRQHSVHGVVQPGFQRGRNVLGFATANLDPGPLLLPPNGVYACLARCETEYYAAACNLGRNPSFGGGKISLEAHILDFAGDIYGKDLRLYFIERLRSEKTFSSPEELGRQIALDVGQTRAVIAGEMENPAFATLYPL